MNKYKILYWINSIQTEYHYIRAENEKAAEEKFRKIKGQNPRIISIENITE